MKRLILGRLETARGRFSVHSLKITEKLPYVDERLD